MKCLKCGREIAEDSQFCEYCGTMVNVNCSKKVSAKTIWTILGVLIGIACLVWGGLMMSDYIDNQKELSRSKELSSLGVDDWIDLGLPSGTLWYGKNVDGPFFNYDRAEELFGGNMPTKNQFEELIGYCNCTWKGDGYLIEGCNGKSIFLPAAGYLSNTLLSVGSFGIYWSSSSDIIEDKKQAWGLALGHDELSTLECNQYDCGNYSNFLVRLVKTPSIQGKSETNHKLSGEINPIVAGETWSYVEHLSDGDVPTYFIFTSKTDVIWLFGTPFGNMFPVGFGKYNSSTHDVTFASSNKLHKNISLYYGNNDIVFHIDRDNKTAVLKSDDSGLRIFYNAGSRFDIKKENKKLLPSKKLVGSTWYSTNAEYKIYFKTTNEAVLCEEQENISMGYICIGNMLAIKSGDNIDDENLIGDIINGYEVTLCREGLSKERGSWCIKLTKDTPECIAK